ncbi:hypothetical protein [Flavobacterium tegetincola]|uniref:hypothetical protein n=1 Tax=Flavobacterium tegetincola TaxID=150172 RepID=UPI00041C06B0|nr:hypothetical protein [Flavobacterium tegetincola]
MLAPASAIRKDIFNIQIDVGGYSDLFFLIIDLLKTAMLALEGMENSNDKCIEKEIYIRGLLNIIEKMIPLEEAELLDIMHQKYLAEVKPSKGSKPCEG